MQSTARLITVGGYLMKKNTRIEQLITQIPYLDQVAQTKPVFLINQTKPEFVEAAKKTHFTKQDVNDAEARLKRFAAYLRVAFPETEATEGIIESKLTPLTQMKTELETYFETRIEGDILLKRDDLLPIAGTIKARGAIYEVLKHAETLALTHGLLESTEDDYRKFTQAEFKKFFSKYKIVVGTTGNLGISVGVMGAALGFEVAVHMSLEAKAWKKNLLRSRGVTVIEHNTNFTLAVEKGRQEAQENANCYFVDDEHSVELFLGYTVAGNRLERQLEERGIQVDADHPLFVYLPCGIGGSPGGITFGLKQVYGDHVHCFFAEPTHMPSMLLGLMTREYDNVSIDEFDIDGSLTQMDGLAVPRTSGLVAKLMHDYFDGGYTVSEEDNFHLLRSLVDLEDIALEPAAVAGLSGPARLFKSDLGRKYLSDKGLADKMSQATHIVWATGGSMVPQEDRDAFYNAIDAYL